MLDRRVFLTSLAVASTFGVSLPAFAATQVPFTKQAFEEAQKAGQPILVEITASWCPTCKAQKKIMGELLKSPDLDKLAIFEVDFDSQKDVVRGFGAQMQSTLITFKGATEVGRSVGDTKAESIKQLLDTAIS